MACRAEPSFSSCFTLIFTISCRNFSLDSLESRPESSACLRLSSSDSRPSSGGVSGAAAGGVAVAAVGGAGWAGPPGDVTVQTGTGAPLGELRSLAELLDEVKDGDDKDDSDDVTVGVKRVGKKKILLVSNTEGDSSRSKKKIYRRKENAVVSVRRFREALARISEGYGKVKPHGNRIKPKTVKMAPLPP